MSFKETMQNLKSELSFQFKEAAKYTVPSLYRQYYEKKAKTVFENTQQGCAWTGLNNDAIQQYLREAGHDPETDKPYQKVLGLDGGKAEYKETLQRLASRDVEVVTTLKQPDSSGPE